MAGLAQNPGMLITARGIQGLGAGGLSALAQIIMAAMISPRERGRYSGYLGATFAVATVGDPLLGGVITDTSWLGWRWCLYVGVPFAIIALIVLQKTLNLPVVKRKVKVDWAGAFFVTAAVCLLLVWVTFADDKYSWMSWQTGAMVGGAIVLTLIFLFVESKASEPIIPLRLFKNRTITLASLASLFVGIAMFAGTVYFSQYFQLARGESPTMSGVMTIPMIGGLFNIVHRLRSDHHQDRQVEGLAAGRRRAAHGGPGPAEHHALRHRVLAHRDLHGADGPRRRHDDAEPGPVHAEPGGPERPGRGLLRRDLLPVPRRRGGRLGARLRDVVPDQPLRLRHHRAAQPAGAGAAAEASGGGAIPDMSLLPHGIREWLESAYGHGIADIFLHVAPIALLGFLVTLFIKEVPLRTSGRPGPGGGGLRRDRPSPAALAPAEATRVTPEPVPAGAMAAASAAPSATSATSATSVAEPGLRPEATQRLAAVATATGSGEPGAHVSGGIAVRAFVRGAESAPVPQAAVTLISLGGRQLGRSVAQADGSYVLDAPSAGSYVLIASADGFQPQASTIVVNDEPVAYDILLSGTSGLNGLVRAVESGLPVKDAMVIVTDVRGDLLASAATGEAGEFSFTELVPGTVTVAVNAAGYRPRALPLEVGGTGVTRVEVDLQAGAQVQGVVRAPHGPLADARVTLVDAAGNVVGTATTGADGAYAFTDLDAGEYTVIATGYPPVATALTVAGQGADGHDIELAHPGE